MTETTPAAVPWPRLATRLVIWALFLFFLYLVRDFFFFAFMTFLFSFLALKLVGWGMARLSPHQDRPWLRRLLTIGAFVLAPVLLFVAGGLILPSVIVQGQHLVGWLSRMNPETEVARLIESYFGPAEFRRQYGGPSDPRYQKALAEFQQTGERHVTDYTEFRLLEDWIEGGFAKQYDEAERRRLRAKLAAEGTSGPDFEQWLFKKKVPALKAVGADNPLVRAGADPEQLLRLARRDPALRAVLQEEWLDDAVGRELAASRSSPAYREQFRAFYEQRRHDSPRTVPYTFEQFTELQQARAKGRVAFGAAVESMWPTGGPDGGDERLRADFEAARRHEMFEQWWGGSSAAKFIHHQLESNAAGVSTDRLERLLTQLVNVPLDLSTALLLAFFICIDFEGLRRAGRRLRETWLRDAYDEVVPALAGLASLVGRSLQAQGLIAACNSTLLFIFLQVLGVEHAALLAATAFVLCLVPTFGTMISWVLIVLVALFQPAGGLALALKATVAVVVVILLETFVFSPRILGRLMELHPVLIIAVMPVAHYFFGIWGLVLAVPVSVYVVNEVIFARSRSVPPAGKEEP
jgi:predicted PurR-regulated permease PerM